MALETQDRQPFIDALTQALNIPAVQPSVYVKSVLVWCYHDAEDLAGLSYQSMVYTGLPIMRAIAGSWCCSSRNLGMTV